MGSGVLICAGLAKNTFHVATSRQKTPASRIEFSEMTEFDLDEIMRVERLSFRTPWSRNMFMEELGRHQSRTFVARAADLPGEPLVGYVMFWTILDELHILNIAVDPEWRRAGVGTELMNLVFRYAAESTAAVIVLDVRVGNAPARRLYEQFGFRAVGIRPQYYSDTGEDALVMIRESPFTTLVPEAVGDAPADGKGKK